MEETDRMWKVVYIAPNRSIAETLRDLLDGEGILATLRPLGGFSKENSVPHERGSFELLVPESELEEATDVLSGAIGP